MKGLVLARTPLIACALLAMAGAQQPLMSQTAMAQSAHFWPLLCRGPLPQLTVRQGMMALIARPGQRAGSPARGECVWLDRGVNRPQETRRGLMVVRLRIAGAPLLRSLNGREHHVIMRDNRAKHIWAQNQRGSTFRIGARRVNTGLYDGQYTPTAMPRPAATPRATPAPRAESAPARPRVWAKPAPAADPRPRLRAQPAPRAGNPGAVRARPAP